MCIYLSTFDMVNLTVKFSCTLGSINLGFVTMTIMFPNSVNINNFLSWQLINSSHARVNKPLHQ